MAQLVLSEHELVRLIASIVGEGGRSDIATLLDDAPEFQTFGSLMPHEEYFCKKLAYQDYAVHFRFFETDDQTVRSADIQFKRSSGFRWGFGSPNRRLIAELRNVLSHEYGERGVVTKDTKGGRRIHFKVSDIAAVWDTSGAFDESASECSIYDEPNSSGQTDPSETTIRNDFVIFRFRRKTQ